MTNKREGYLARRAREGREQAVIDAAYWRKWRYIAIPWYGIPIIVTTGCLYHGYWYSLMILLIGAFMSLPITHFFVDVIQSPSVLIPRSPKQGYEFGSRFGARYRKPDALVQIFILAELLMFVAFYWGFTVLGALLAVGLLPITH